MILKCLVAETELESEGPCDSGAQPAAPLALRHSQPHQVSPGVRQQQRPVLYRELEPTQETWEPQGGSHPRGYIQC